MPTAFFKYRQKPSQNRMQRRRNKKKKKVCVDWDGTAGNFHGGIKITLAKRGHTFHPENCVDYHFNGEIGCDKQLIYDLFTDEALYDNIPLYDGAEEAISLLLENCETVYGYTASVSKPSIFNQRVKLVEKFGMVPKVFVDRKPVMDADALFDDCLGVHRCWVEANSKAKLYLINQPHNQITEENKDDPIWKRVIRCNSLLEAVQLYLQDTDE